LYIYHPNIEVTKRKKATAPNQRQKNSRIGNFLVDIIPTMSYIEHVESSDVL